jgi:uncharacterized protein YlaI
LKILNKSYVCGEERLRDCIGSLKALNNVSEENRAITLKFHELPEQLSRGIELKVAKTYHSSNNNDVLFSVEEAHLGNYYEFRFKCSKRDEIIARVYNLSRSMWEIRAFRKEGRDESALLTEEFFYANSDSVLFLINSVVDILEMTCFYASLHTTFTDMTINLKRYIVFQYDLQEQKSTTFVGKAIKGTQLRDKPFRTFLTNNCGWQIVETKAFRRENFKSQEVHVGSPFYSIPSRFYNK